MKYQEIVSFLKGKSGLYEIMTPEGKERRRLFVSDNNLVCEFKPRSRKRGYPVDVDAVTAWVEIKPYIPEEKNIVAKFKRYAGRATFPSEFIRKCLAADTSKSCYENGLTTGSRIDGEIISLNAITRYAPWEVGQFRKALSERKNYESDRFEFRGYEGTLYVGVVENDGSYYRKGDVMANFSKEYHGCGNGYYYALIADEHFIGIDVD